MTLIRHTVVLGQIVSLARLLDCVHYIGDFVIPGLVISGFCTINFTVTLAGLNNIIRYNQCT